MLTQKQKSFFVSTLLLALYTPLTLWGDEAPGSRLYWLQNPREFIEKNRSEKSALEECVAQLGFVDHVRILPNSGTNLIEIDIKNVSRIAISGLLVQPVGDQLKRLNLDRRVLINFDTILPGDSATYSEEIDGHFDEFPDETSVEVVAWDIVDEHGEQLIRHIFWSQWPTISSEDDLKFARRELCYGGE